MASDDPSRAAALERFVAYRRTGDPAIRDELVTAHLRLATHLARRFEHRGVPLDDLVQVASLGLVQAVERFDPEHGAEFATFATPTIVGELKRHFRDKGWSVRVPRRVQELHLRIGALVGELTQQEGRSPTIAELAVAARSSPEEVLEAIEAAEAYRAISLEGPGPQSEEPAGDLLGAVDDQLGHVEDRLVVERLIGALPPREQLMVRLRFFEEMTQADIAERLGLSQMHVSRLLARCLDRLRVLLAADEAADPPGDDPATA